MASSPSPPPGEEEDQSSWSHVLDLLKAKNDNKRFAGLLLVTKCVRSNDDAKRREVFEAVGGVDFLLRLLLPLRQARVHPKPSLSQDEVDGQVQLAALGLSIVSNLCMSEAVARADGMARVAGVATDALRIGPERLIRQYVRCEEARDVRLRLEPGVHRGMIRDACDCVYLVSDEVDRRAAVAGISFVRSVCEDVVGVDTEQRQALSCLRSVLRCCLKVPGGLTAEVVSKLFVVDDAQKSGVADGVEGLDGVDGDANVGVPLRRSLEVLAFLDEAAQRAPLVLDDNEESDKESARTCELLRRGLHVILASRPPEAPRYQALRLSNALASRSIEWLVEEMPFFELLVQTVRVEIGVLMLDAVQLDAAVSELRNLEIGGGEGGNEGGGNDRTKDGGRRARDRALENLPACFALFELLVDGLCDASAVMETNPAVGRIFEALTESAELMLQYVELADNDAERSSSNDTYRALLKLGAFRGFCAYASQNPLQFQDRMLRALEVNDFPVRLALPALYGVAVVHGRPIVETPIVLKLMDEAARINDLDDDLDDGVLSTGANEVLIEVLLHALRDVTDPSVLVRARSYPREFGVEAALATSSSEDEQVAALAVTCRCFLLCPEHEPLLRRLIEACVPNIIEEIFPAGGGAGDGDNGAEMSPLVQEMFDGLLAASNASNDIARIEVAGNTLLDLCNMFESRGC